LLLDPLRALEAAPKAPAAYFRALTGFPDIYIQAGAWAQLLATNSVHESDWPEIIRQSRYLHIRKLAVEYFELALEHSFALRAAEATEPVRDLDRAALVARLTFDTDGLVESESSKFLETGAIGQLLKAAKAAEEGKGWSAALPWLARALALNPAAQEVAISVCGLLLQSSQFELARSFSAQLARAKLHLQLGPLAEGIALIQAGDYANGIETLKQMHTTGITSEAQRRQLDVYAKIHIADAYDKIGDYRKSLNAYAEANRLPRSPTYDPKQHYENVDRRKRLTIGTLAPDDRRDVTFMLGFPRSGTTLLENALNAHPLVETFEEIPSHKAAVVYIYRKLGASNPPAQETIPIYEEARRRYYKEIDIRRRKPHATALVDKLPIQTDEASFMRRLFPERRYIFSIRHPFDVVLSCFRQQFLPNAAMENFRTIEDAVRLYDFAMREWFEVFDLASPEVCYVRYEELVTDFEATVRRTLRFLNVDWDSAVLDFAREAGKRGYKTPSYQKVRKGLSIGVQTYWRNYDFVFQSPAAKALHKWAEFFGYETK
jgi:tetratricopeptide (TPR) repeat protein